MKTTIQQYRKVLALIYQLEKRTYLYSFAYSLLSVGLPYLTLWFTATLLNQLQAQAGFNQLVQLVVIFCGLIFAVTVLRDLVEKQRDDIENHLRNQLTKKVNQKLLTISYFQLQDPDLRAAYQKAKEGTNFNGGLYSFVHNLLDTFFNGVIAVGFGLFTFYQLSQASTPSEAPLAQWSDHWSFTAGLVLLVILPVVVNVLLARLNVRLQMKFFDQVTFINRLFSYYYGTVQEYRNGAFFRLYHVAPQFMGKIKEFDDLTVTSFGQLTKVGNRIQAVSSGVSYGVTIGLYSLIGLKAYFGGIAIGQVVLFAGYFVQLIEGLTKVFQNFVEGSAIVQYLDFYYDFINLSVENPGTLPVEKRDDQQYLIEFHDVSFKYPQSSTWALRHISLRLNIGEKIAIVGPNGSGKTTFVKLLCRLYPVTEGVITLNGIAIDKYDPVEYQRILGVVFQDFQLFAFSLAENVATSHDPDTSRVNRALQLAGIADRVAKMPQGLKTTLYKNLDPAGVDISGGEAQKIAIARAWYKDAPFVILDEPTSALDPYAEYEIYQRFAELVADKTAIYISHRMSSARFAQKIIVFERGEIKESGTHQRLLDTGGLYSQLYNAQAQYYQENDQQAAALYQ